jgi:hypothetical protein
LCAAEIRRSVLGVAMCRIAAYNKTMNLDLQITRQAFVTFVDVPYTLVVSLQKRNVLSLEPLIKLDRLVDRGQYCAALDISIVC